MQRLLDHVQHCLLEGLASVEQSLAHGALGDVEKSGDLRLGVFTDVVERDGFAMVLGQRGDGMADGVGRLGALELVQRAGIVDVGCDFLDSLQRHGGQSGATEVPVTVLVHDAP